MNDLIEVVDATYIDEFRLLIQFDNGEKKIVDLKDELDGEIFQLLKDKNYFKKFSVNKELGIIQWPNEADMAPERLYKIGIPA